MQPRQYRTPIATTIVVGVFGVLLLALDVALVVIYGIMSHGSGSGAIIIGAIGLPLALFFVASALRPATLTADDAGLHDRSIFGNKHIPWETVQAFRVDPGGYGHSTNLHAILRTGKVIALSTPTSSGDTARRIAGELTEALREHAEPAVLHPGDGQAPAANSE